MRPYQYRCNDYSLLTPSFKQWVISPLIRFVPWAIPANIITLISNLFVYIGLYLSLHPQWLGVYTPLSVAACLLFYLIGDHLDGMQAKRTGTGSALGEFCDHYLDAFNNGIIVYIMFTIFDISNSMLIAPVIIVSYLAHMSVFYEQFKTGWLTFERIGSLEGVLLSALLIALSSIESFYSLMMYSIAGKFSIAEVVIVSSALGALGTFIQTFKRTPDVKSGYWIFALLLLVVGALGVFVFTNFQLFIILTLYASFYIGRIMYGHLIDGVESGADWVVPVLLLLYFVLNVSNTEYFFFWLLTFYLVARIMVLIIKTFSTLRDLLGMAKRPRVSCAYLN